LGFALLNPTYESTTQVFDEEVEILPVPEFAQDFQITLGALFGWLRD
jgi:hypothetical protein